MLNIVLTENKSLQIKFQQLYTKLIGLNLSGVVDELYAKFVISHDDKEVLDHIKDQKQKNRELMNILNRSGNKQTFINLRSAINEEKANLWFIELLDNMELDVENVEQQDDKRTGAASAASASPRGIIHLSTSAVR